MRPVVVSDVLAVGEVPTREQIAILARAGFKSLIDNQPDGEVERLPTSAEIGAECAKVGLAYRYVPLESRTPPEQDLARFAAAIREMPAPIYACCYSGSRSAAGCALVLAREQDAAAIIKSFADAGYDVSGLKPWLEAGRPGPAPKSANGANGQHAPPHGVSGDAAEPASTSAPAADAPAPAAYKPIVVLPRASSSGGFAI